MMYGSGSPKPAAGPVCGLTKPILNGIASAADGATLAPPLGATLEPAEAAELAAPELDVLTPQAARKAEMPVAIVPRAAAFRTARRDRREPSLSSCSDIGCSPPRARSSDPTATSGGLRAGARGGDCTQCKCHSAHLAMVRWTLWKPTRQCKACVHSVDAILVARGLSHYGAGRPTASTRRHHGYGHRTAADALADRWSVLRGGAP